MRGLQSQIAADVGRLMESIVEDNLHDLPQKPLASVVSSYKNGIYKRETFYGRGYPSARMFNIQNGMVNLKEAPLLDVTPEELCQYGLLPGDILVNRVNSRELVGKAGLVLDGTPPCTFESKNIRLRVNRTLADPRFVTFVLNSRMTKVQIQRLQKPAIGQATVNQSDLDSLVIPLPDLAKQIQIAQTLIEARQAISAMIGEQEQTRRYLEQLEQSILAQAFRGEV